MIAGSSRKARSPCSSTKSSNSSAEVVAEVGPVRVAAQLDLLPDIEVGVELRAGGPRPGLRRVSIWASIASASGAPASVSALSAAMRSSSSTKGASKSRWAIRPVLRISARAGKRLPLTRGRRGRAARRPESAGPCPSPSRRGSSSSSKCLPSLATVPSLIRVCPGLAREHSRDPVFTGSPMTVYSSAWLLPM